jgi:hypothetical protein
LGSGDLALTFLILNKAASSVLLEETVAVEIASTDFSNNTFRNNALCKLLPAHIAAKSTSENFLHPGKVSLHRSMDKPAHFLDEANENFTPNPPFADDGKLDVAYYDPKSISTDGKELAPGPVAIDSGKALGVSAAFVTDPFSWDAHNVLTLCGAIRYLSNDGRDTWAVCPAQTVGQMYDSGGGVGRAFGPFATTPFKLGSNSNDIRCGIWKAM